MVFFCFFDQESLGPGSLVLKKIRGGEHVLAHCAMEKEHSCSARIVGRLLLSHS